MRADHKHPDGREKAWHGISKATAAFLQREWPPNGAEYATLRTRDGFDYIVWPRTTKRGHKEWCGKVWHIPSGRVERIKVGEGRMSPEDAKLVLYQKMAEIKKELKTKARGRRRG